MTIEEKDNLLKSEANNSCKSSHNYLAISMRMDLNNNITNWTRRRKD